MRRIAKNSLFFEHLLIYLLLLSTPSTLSCCGNETSGEVSDAGESSSEVSAGEAPNVTPSTSAQFLFTWISEDGEFHVTRTLEDIPAARREKVRVLDPSQPPLDSSKIWVADLREPHNGRYKVTLMERAIFEASVRRNQRPAKSGDSIAAGEPTQSGDTPASTTGDTPRVVMYMTNSCPVCRRARRWLAAQNVSFIERNIERDPAAAQELQTKAAQQGVSAQGVPVFDVGGRLIAGFDQRALSQALER